MCETGVQNPTRGGKIQCVALAPPSTTIKDGCTIVSGVYVANPLYVAHMYTDCTASGRYTYPYVEGREDPRVEGGEKKNRVKKPWHVHTQLKKGK